MGEAEMLWKRKKKGAERMEADFVEYEGKWYGYVVKPYRYEIEEITGDTAVVIRDENGKLVAEIRIITR
jgi:hypothetical protein